MLRSGVRVKTNGDFITVKLTVCPVAAAPSASPEPLLYLVILEQAQAPLISDQLSVTIGLDSKPSPKPGNADADARVADLKRELQAKEEYLQNANEELEASNSRQSSHFLNSSNKRTCHQMTDSSSLQAVIGFLFRFYYKRYKFWHLICKI